MKPDNPIILALDFNNLDDAKGILSKVRNHIGMIKVGSELFTAYGKEALSLSGMFNIPLFLDIKLFDIPTTVARTVEVVCETMAQYQGKHFLSVHCWGGLEMCTAALDAAENSNVEIAGVTTLTSMSESDFREIGFRDSRAGTRTVDSAYVGYDCRNEVRQYDTAGKRIYSGLTHFICAPTQVPLMRQHLGDDVVLITPGIRADSEEAHDHARSKPASFALKNGATWLVIGRPITQSANPANAAQYFELQAQKYR